MSLTGNVVNQIGDTLYIKTLTPEVGVITLSGFVDVTNESGSNIYTKTFRYSQNGITFSDWLPLTNDNLMAIPVTIYDSLTFECKYVPSTTGLTVTSVTFNTSDATIPNGTIFQNSIFSQFFNCNDVNVLQWYINVTEKIYKTGILARYIHREDESGSPEDFILLWKAVSKFFAYYVEYARIWEEFYNNPILIREYLTQRGLYVTDTQTLQECQALMETFDQQIRLRGTTKVYTSIEVNGLTIDGELLRSIFHEPTDEFIFNSYSPFHVGWTIDSCSPLFKGLEFNENANKSWEQNSINLITNYPQIGTGNSVITDTDGITKLIQITTTTTSGIGYNNSSASFKPIIVNSELDYQISFMIRKDSTSNFDFGIDCFDVNGNLLQTISNLTGAVAANNLSLTNQGFPKSTVFYTVKCALYNTSKTFFTQDQLNINAGQNLIMPIGTTQIIPKLYVNNGSAQLKEIKVFPLQTEYERGFIQSPYFVSNWINNRNQNFTTLQLENLFKKYFIPYDSFIKLTQIGTYIYNDIDEIVPPPESDLAWIAGPFSCEYNPI